MEGIPKETCGKDLMQGIALQSSSEILGRKLITTDHSEGVLRTGH
jgi:hypothetical protein